MKKLTMSAAIMAFLVTAQVMAAPTVMPTVMSVMTAIKFTKTGSSELKRLAQAAQEDAVLFAQTNGQSPKTVVLIEALNELAQSYDTTGLSEVDMAQVIAMLGSGE